jgi:hypothetical protein
MGSYLCVGTFILALDPFYGLTINFSCSYNLLKGDLPVQAHPVDLNTYYCRDKGAME